MNYHCYLPLVFPVFFTLIIVYYLPFAFLYFVHPIFLTCLKLIIFRISNFILFLSTLVLDYFIIKHGAALSNAAHSVLCVYLFCWGAESFRLQFPVAPRTRGVVVVVPKSKYPPSMRDTYAPWRGRG